MQLIGATIETFTTIRVIFDEPIHIAAVHVVDNTILSVEAEEDERFHIVTVNEPLSMHHPVHVLWQQQDIIATTGAVVRTEAFDHRYQYDGPLGVEVTDDLTTFRLWAPTAMSVSLNLYPDTDPNAIVAQSYTMIRNAKGVWAISFQGDTEGIVYDYRIVFPNGMVHYTYDPYARGCVINGRRSVVMPDHVLNPSYLEDTPVDSFPHASDAIITQVHIKDMTMSDSSGLHNELKGTYLGMIESGTTNEKGQPTGLDYIKQLGVTHVQLMPIADFGSVDEHHKDDYSWGYDPLNFNIPEGSYATDPSQPDVRIIEAKKMIYGYHKQGIRVILDMVYSHVYEASQHAFHLTVPGYYFRYDEEGYISNGTFTGNDLATERYMVRRYILDSVRYWIDTYHIDGICFHLMGAMDIETMKQLRQMVDTINPDIMLLGEGWNVETALSDEQRAIVSHASKMPRVSFYNEALSQVVRGYETKEVKQGFIHHHNKREADVFHYHMAYLPQAYQPSPFTGPDQVIQSVETHRYLTLNDKLEQLYPDESLALRQQRIMLATSLVFLAQGGVSFELGQSFLRSKNGNANGYYSLEDECIDWDTAYQYPKLLQYVKDLIAFRQAHPIFHQHHYVDLEHSVTLLQADNGVLAYVLEDETTQYIVVFNANEKEYTLSIASGSYKILVSNGIIRNDPQYIDVVDAIHLSPLDTMVLMR